MGRGHKDKVAVVTGAAEGLGRAFAVRLAEEGADVVLVDRNACDETLRLIKDTGRRALAVHCDLAKSDAIAGLGREVETAFSRCDILINAAGIYPPQMFDDIGLEDWRRVLSVNLDGTFLLTKTFWPGMRQRGWGRIVNIASDTVLLPIPAFTHYITSKAAIIG